MASSQTLPGSYYKPVNRSLFELDIDTTVSPKNGQTSQNQTSGKQQHEQQQPSTSPSLVSVTTFQYREPNLSGFENLTIDETPPSARVSNGDSTVEQGTPRPNPAGNEATSQQQPRASNTAQPPNATMATVFSTNNPYSSIIESRQNAMTVAFLQSQEHRAPVSIPQDSADTFGFGQRYRVAGESGAVVVTNQRVPLEVLSGDLQCIACVETKDVTQFPKGSVTSACNHPPGVCLECVARTIEADLHRKGWKDLRCPECRAELQYHDVQRFANNTSKDKYEQYTVRETMSQVEGFFWCTGPDCGAGQIHEGGAQEPIVICRDCGHRSCFNHKVAWHENLSCEEYDRLREDPANFRSQFDMVNEQADIEAATRRAQEDADRAFAQSLMAQETRERARLDELRRREAERRRVEEREKEREREARRRAAEEQRRIAVRRKQEEEQSQLLVARTTKPCPGCGWAIEKNDGCSHMTCPLCKHEFCYLCLADHRRILAHDNSYHRPNCGLHPNNLQDTYSPPADEPAQMDDDYD
ncbi:hypothetical protein QBC46DRAFT_263708 [Diplogelasinospora grovesii]|uniref:RBR-type E3 ubiquitin transferase n=1 Tax=Diplogelasinospora grovesii TaxID=303347 RepID=A0AAN6S3M2_9PEZI|nr:hypothetical protein QBC46DRAFT_263708 [Diplogelasinospora grovesii]